MPKSVQTNASDEAFFTFFDVWSIAVPYPNLYHYTHCESLKALLESRELWATPTWKFPDMQEYILGLKILREEVLAVRGSGDAYAAFRLNLGKTYDNVAPDANKVLDTVVDMLRYEIENYGNPSVEVYVSSLSTDPKSERMCIEYGDCVVEFSFELPWMAYHAPEPFTSTMLSRVTYDETEFRRRAPGLGLDVSNNPLNDTESQSDWLRTQESRGDREAAVAGWITEELCLLAPNLKRAEFAFENEWRLKSAISAFASSSRFPRRARQSQVSHLPKVARFLDEARSRYCHRLVSVDGGEMLVSGVDLQGRGNDKDLARWVREWRSGRRSPWLRPSSMVMPGSPGLNALLRAPAPFDVPERGALSPLPSELVEFRRRMRCGPADWVPPRVLGVPFAQYEIARARRRRVG
jgi:hypothetical protein